MSSIVPINDDHAVTSVIFSLYLDEFIEPRSIAAGVSQGSWRSELPALVATDAVQIEQAGQTFEIPTAQFAILRPDGRPIWALNFKGSHLTVQCTAYTRWAETSERAKRYLKDAFNIISALQTDLHVLDYRLRVVDQFTTEDIKYSAEDLFQRGDFLGALPFNTGGIWKSKVSWYEDDPSAPHRFFSSLETSVSPKADGDQPVAPLTFSINHFQKMTSRAPGGNILDNLDEVMDFLHERNKDVIKRLLVTSVLDRIGLTDK